MSNPSNLYAEKVFAEHPIALWTFDEVADYIQLIPSGGRDISNSSNWSIGGGTSEEELLLDRAIASEAVYKITTTDSIFCDVYANDLITSYVNPELESINSGFYFYTDSTNIASLNVGYALNGEEFLLEHLVEYGKWQYISVTLPFQSLTPLTIYSDDIDIVDEYDEPLTASLINYIGHGLVDGDRVKISSSYLMPPELTEYSLYYVLNATADQFEIAETEDATEGILFNPNLNSTLFFTKVPRVTPLIRAILRSQQTSEFFISGVSYGQWSEEFIQNSFGQIPSLITGINIPKESYGIESASYGLADYPSYYLARENKLLAKNISVPMVYGSKDLTSLVPDRLGGPSAIIPGFGFLNESGRYKKYTVEMWMRIDPDTSTPKRIFGPINSSDGIYVSGPFITVKIGSNIGSHYVGEWYRPMLVNFLIFQNGASLVINGEKVIDLAFNTSDLELPDKLSLAGTDQDWLGFYSYPSISKFEIDCVSIYSYRVPSAISKRRWVYGQGVDYPENIVSEYSGKSFTADYTFADYSNNQIYPDMTRWRKGISENISLNNDVLQPPEYKLPTLVFNNKTADAWEYSLKNNIYSGIMLKPNQSWSDTEGYVFFDSADILQQKTSGFYGVFRPELGFNSTQTLFRLENPVNGNYLNVELDTDLIDIEEINGTEIVAPSHGLLDNDIIKFVGDLPYDSVPFDKKEYFVVNATDNSFEISESKNGTPISIDPLEEYDSIQASVHSIKYYLKFNSSTESLLYKTPAITVGHSIVAGINYSQFANYFGGNVSTLLGNRRQLNLYVGGNKEFNKTFSGNIYRIGFCTEKNMREMTYLFTANGTPFLRYQFDGGTDLTYDNDEWTGDTVDSGDIYEEYVNDVLSHIASYTLIVKSFFGEKYLDIATKSYWQDYTPLSYFAKNVKDSNNEEKYTVDFIQYNSDTVIPSFFEGSNFDTSDSLIKTFISFQAIEDGATKTADNYVNIKKLPQNKIVDPGSEWRSYLYEVLDGTIIYPPKNIDINNIAIVVHVEMSSDGIMKNPIRLRSLQLSGKALNESLVNPILSKFGVGVLPFKKYGIYYDYGAEKSYIMYKDSTPYLYLNKTSGLELTGSFAEANRGLSLPINREKRADYFLSTVQFFMKFSRNDIVSESKQILEIDNSVPAEKIKIWITPSIPSDKRFRLFATDNDNQELSNVDFYVNGNKLQTPIISINEWNAISVALKSPVNLDQQSGRINIVGPILINNISYFALNETQKALSDIYQQNEYFGVNPTEIYQVFSGTNKSIINDGFSLRVKEYKYSLFTDTTLQSQVMKPA